MRTLILLVVILAALAVIVWPHRKPEAVKPPVRMNGWRVDIQPDMGQAPPSRQVGSKPYDGATGP